MGDVTFFISGEHKQHNCFTSQNVECLAISSEQKIKKGFTTSTYTPMCGDYIISSLCAIIEKYG